MTESATKARADERAATLIGGAFDASGAAVPVVDPYRGEVVGHAPKGDVATVAAAVAAARSGCSAPRSCSTNAPTASPS